MFDLGKLQWASRYQGLGPTLRSEYIGLHHGPDSAGRIAQILRTPVEIRGLRPLTTFGCPRGVDQAPLRVSACNVARAGGKLLLPVAAFVNDSSTAMTMQQSRSSAVCNGHKSSLILLQSDESDGTVWEYVHTIVRPDDVPLATEGPNECALTVMSPGSADGVPELLVMFRDDEPRNGTGAELRRASYKATRTRGSWKQWTHPEPIKTTDGQPMLAVQTESMWLDVTPQKRILVLKGGRPGLHIWSSTTKSDTPEWSHDSNIGAIHNALVQDATLRFGASFVNSTVGALQNHAAGMVRLNSSAFGLVYDRSTWSRPPRDGEKDAVLWLPVRATQCI